MRLRGFEIAKGYEDKDIHMPVRKTKNSAGYDVESASDIVIEPYKNGMKPTLIPTGLKAYCQDDEYYILVNRSSGPKKGLVMANSIGIIDADYYDAKNEWKEHKNYFIYMITFFMPKFSKVLCSASQLFFKKLRLSWAETLRVLPTEKQQSPNRP